MQSKVDDDEILLDKEVMRVITTECLYLSSYLLENIEYDETALYGGLGFLFSLLLMMTINGETFSAVKHEHNNLNVFR